jgi:hypothetical protein
VWAANNGADPRIMRSQPGKQLITEDEQRLEGFRSAQRSPAQGPIVTPPEYEYLRAEVRTELGITLQANDGAVVGLWRFAPD